MKYCINCYLFAQIVVKIRNISWMWHFSRKIWSKLWCKKRMEPFELSCISLLLLLKYLCLSNGSMKNCGIYFQACFRASVFKYEIKIELNFMLIALHTILKGLMFLFENCFFFKFHLTFLQINLISRASIHSPSLLPTIFITEFMTTRQP